jgi:hypothetical protein
MTGTNDLINDNSRVSSLYDPSFEKLDIVRHGLIQSF